MTKKISIITLIVLTLLSICNTTGAQINNNYLIKINNLTRSIQDIESISNKIAINDSLHRYIHTILKDTSSYQLNFDSLEHIHILYPNDSLFRIFNWYTQLSIDIYHYNAIIQYYNKDKDKYEVYKLIDKSETITDPEKAICSDTLWYGALYYNIIKKELTGKTIYTLLGFDYHSPVSRKKVIDILYFDNEGVKFGYPIFTSKLKIARRIVFEYSANVAMTLKYNSDTDMIIFDHLAPTKHLFEGHYEYYGPDLTYDAFKFENEKWIFLKGVDIRNPKK